MDKVLSCSLVLTFVCLCCELISPVTTDSDTVLDSLRQASDELQALEVTYAKKNAI